MNDERITMNGRRIVCIECPKSCVLTVNIEGCKVLDVKGAGCPKGAAYAVSESENPKRIFTSTVRAEGLSIKLVPVRTDKPVPKKDILSIAQAVRKIKITGPVKTGDVIKEDLLGLGIKLLATRSAA
jgi:CxxC motif-containing protein